MRPSQGPLFVAADLGTTGARAVAVDLDGRVRAEVRRPYRTRTPRPGFAEQDPHDWEEQVIEALAGLARRRGIAERVEAIGLTGQCPTVAPFDTNGRPTGPGMLYRDNRAVVEATEMRVRLGASAMHRRTGHVAEAFHIGPKVLWLRRNAPEVFQSTVRFLQPRDVALRRLTGREATDESHADATLFFDLRQRAWAPDLFAAFDLDPSLFPDALAPWTVAGELVTGAELPAGIPVIIGAGDSQCAAFGAGVIAPGPVSEMAGSSSCLNSVVAEPLDDPGVNHYSHVVPKLYTTEMGLNTSGAAITWAVAQLQYGSYTELEADAKRFMRKRGRSDNLREMAPLFLPYLGDGDRDDPNLRGVFYGLSLRHNRDALAYAVLEGVALGITSTLGYLEKAGSPVEELRVSGGGARLSLLGQLKADALDRPVLHLDADATATGAALLAASVAGYGEEAMRGIEAIVNRAERFVPDRRGREIAAERAAYFEEVRAEVRV